MSKLKKIFLLGVFIVIAVHYGYAKTIVPISENDTTHYKYGGTMPIREIDKSEVFKDFPFLEDLLIEKINVMDSLNTISRSKGFKPADGLELSIYPDPDNPQQLLYVITIRVDGPYVWDQTYTPATDGDLSYFCINGHTVLFSYRDKNNKNLKNYPTTNGVKEVPLKRCGIDDSKYWIYEVINGKVELTWYFGG